MTAPTRPADRASIEAEVFAITRGLLEELGSGTAAEIRGTAHLERDLGLGSLERVELAERIVREFRNKDGPAGVPLPDEAIAAAETLDDIVAALAEQPAAPSADSQQNPPAEAPSSPEAAQVAMPRSIPKDSGGLLQRGIETLYGIYAAGLFIFWLAGSWCIVRLTPNRRAAARFTSASLRTYLRLVFCRVEVFGREHLSTPGPRVLVSNHASYLDVLVLMAALGVDYHFVAKREVHNMPFIGLFMRKLGHFDFDRGSRSERLRQAEQLTEALRSGESVFVFPEGTFTAQDGVRPFHLGAFKAAASAGCPIVPVALRGTRRFLRDGTYLPRPTSVTITVCPPIAPPPGGRDSWREVLQLRNQTRAQIAQLAGEPLV